MTETPSVSPTSGSFADGRWELAQRVADSANFRNCPKLRAFLLYVCENMLLGRQENVREQLIGSRVFGRTADYNLSDDNIVRVEARELRRRLENFFATEGSLEPVIIEVPKGAYLPVFRAREIAPTPAVEPLPAASQVESPVPGDARQRAYRRWPQWSWLLVFALAITTGWQAVENWQARTQRQPALAVKESMSARDFALYRELLVLQR